MFCQIEKETGGIDILVNNAGIAWFGLLTDMTDEDWSSLLQTNLSSVFYCCRAAAAGAVLKPQGGNCAVLP